MQAPDGRPIYLDLPKIKLPIPGIVSLLHRVFGVALCISIPFFSYLFALSLSGERGFDQALSILSATIMIPFYFGLLWSFIHHLFAGIRFLLIDVEIGVDKKNSYNSSVLVLVGSIVVTLILAMGIWL